MPDPAPSKQLQSLPGIGPNLARDLLDLGFEAPDDLRGADPEVMYADLCEMRGGHVDRCVLYAFRCAVHVASGDDSDPELRKWWNWKGRRTGFEART